MQYRNWIGSKRRPTEADFTLRINRETLELETGLSVNWEKYCTIHSLFVYIGMQKTRNGGEVNPKDFRLVKLNVGSIRNLKLLSNEKIDVIHIPENDNAAHAEIQSEDHDEIRLKLCDLVEKDEDAVIFPVDFTEIIEEIAATKKAINNV